ncbi:MAG: hypothetical protein R6U44_11240 [Archaeoglobaceae archaeon]
MIGSDKGQESKPREKTIYTSFYRAARSFVSVLPILLGVMLLLGLFNTVVPRKVISSVFTGHVLGDTVIGALAGSALAGNPITSYIIGGELLADGVSLLAVTAFIVAWVTVGVIQYPAEAGILGRKFAAIRNLVSFVLAILVSIATVTTLMVIQ